MADEARMIGDDRTERRKEEAFLLPVVLLLRSKAATAKSSEGRRGTGW
jgi:hypothetical protein